jgi:hypothetical protein
LAYLIATNKKFPVGVVVLTYEVYDRYQIYAYTNPSIVGRLSNLDLKKIYLNVLDSYAGKFNFSEDQKFNLVNSAIHSHKPN